MANPLDGVSETLRVERYFAITTRCQLNSQINSQHNKTCWHCGRPLFCLFLPKNEHIRTKLIHKTMIQTDQNISLNDAVDIYSWGVVMGRRMCLHVYVSQSTSHPAYKLEPVNSSELIKTTKLAKCGERDREMKCQMTLFYRVRQIKKFTRNSEHFCSQQQTNIHSFNHTNVSLRQFTNSWWWEQNRFNNYFIHPL